VTFTHDYSNHRQTGEVGFVKSNGDAVDVFPVNDPIVGAAGVPLQKRDRQSYAILNKFAAEYRGEFGPLRVNLGASLPYFKRDLENNCFTSSAAGFVECSGGVDALDDLIGAENPYVVNDEGTPATGAFAPPGKRVLKYNKFLPTIGLVYEITNQVSAFGSYTKNISVPSTDSLYNAFYFPSDTPNAKPRPETTDSFDLGLRYRSSKIQAQFAGWFTKFNDRLASAYDPELDRSVFRNLGRVDKWGIDGSIAYEPIPALTLYAFGSWQKSEIKDNIQLSENFGITDCDAVTDQTTTAALRSCAFTAGNYESGGPKYMFGGSALGRFGIFELGATVKRTGPRYVFDTNLPTFLNGTTQGSAAAVEIFPAKTPAYTLVNLDARVKLTMLKGLEKSYFQLNVYNLFDEFYVGGFGGGLNQAVNTAGTSYGNPAFVQIGAPRTISGTLSIGF
jgi:iron complex outermembrane receptor protein